MNLTLMMIKYKHQSWTNRFWNRQTSFYPFVLNISTSVYYTHNSLICSMCPISTTGVKIVFNYCFLIKTVQTRLECENPRRSTEAMSFFPTPLNHECILCTLTDLRTPDFDSEPLCFHRKASLCVERGSVKCSAALQLSEAVPSPCMLTKCMCWMGEGRG